MAEQYDNPYDDPDYWSKTYGTEADAPEPVMVEPSAAAEPVAEPAPAPELSPADENYWSQTYGVEEPPAPVEAAPIEEDPTWQDYGRMVMSGGANVAGGLGWLVEKAGEKMGAESVQQAGGMLKNRAMRSAEQWNNERLDAVGLDEEGLSPQAREAMQTELLGQGELGDKWNKVKLMTASSMLGTMAGMGAGRVFTAALAKVPGVGGGVAAGVGYGLGEAGVAAPATGAYTEEEIRQMSHEELLDSFEYQAALEALDLPEAEAREKAKEIVAKAAGGDAAAISMVSTFLLSAPFGNALNKVLGGEAGGMLRSSMRGAGTEATQEFLQSGGEAIASNIAKTRANPNQDLLEGALEEAVGGAAAGGLMGGTLGLAGGRQTPEAEGPSPVDAIEAAQTAAAEQVAAEGGDMLDQVTAANEAAARVLDPYQRATRPVEQVAESIFEAAAQREITDAEYAELAATPAAERTPVREVAREKLIPESEMAAAEEADAAARAEDQAAAAKRYERQQRAEAARPAEEARERQLEAERREAEYQAELQKGDAKERAGEAQPANPVMAQAFAKAEQEKVGKAAKQAAKSVAELARDARVKKAKAKAQADIEAATKADNLLPRQPDVVVNATGEALTKDQINLEKKRLEVDAAAGEEPLKPSDLKMERRLGGLRIAIETPEGNTRTGKRPDGSTWSTTMKGVDYGFFRGTKGAEGDQVDAFVNTRKGAPADKVFVIDQLNREGGFDEHKVMVGFRNEAEAVRAYSRHYEDGWQVGPVTEMTGEELARWVREGKKDQPVSGQIPEPTTAEGAPEQAPAVEAPAPEAPAAEAPAAEEEPALVVPNDEGGYDVMKGGEKIFSHRNEKAAEAFARGASKKIQLALPKGLRFNMEEEVFDPDVFVRAGSEINLEMLDGDKVVGGITADVNPEQKVIRIAVSKVDPEYQGRKLGLEMYNFLIEEARRRGYNIESDTGVSPDAQNIYAALERRGAKVWRNPQAIRNDRGGLLSHELATPVYRIDLSGVTEPIKLSLRDIMDAEDAAFSEGLEEGPVNHEEFAAFIENLAMTYPGLGDVEVMRSPRESQFYEDMRADFPNVAKFAKGMHASEHELIQLYTDNMDSFMDGIATFLHEAVAHRGMQAVLGVEKRDAILQEIWDKKSDAQERRIRTLAEAYGFDMNDSEERLIAVEEYVAEMAETMDISPDSLLTRVVDAIRAFLREIGVLDSWTDQDILALLRDVRRGLRGKPLNKLKLESEAEIEETGEVVVLEEQADRALSRVEKRQNVVRQLMECVA